jgi:hypothetical protein
MGQPAISFNAAAGTLLKKRSETLRSNTMTSLDSRKHADCALQDSDHREHGRHAERDAGNTDERPDAMTA